MCEEDYLRVRREWPQLHLPHPRDLSPYFRNLIRELDWQQLIARRTARLLERREPLIPEASEARLYTDFVILRSTT